MYPLRVPYFRSFDEGDSELARGANKWDTILRRDMTRRQGDTILPGGHDPNV